MMINYLAPIFRSQFNLFYRYGYTHIPASQVIKFDGKITNEIKHSLVELFTSISPFEYDEEYVVLHLEAEGSDNVGNILFEIQNVVSVYPLSKQAKISIESKIDERIRLEQPIFESVLTEIENNIHKAEIRKAIDALWLICNLEGSKDELIAEIGIDSIFQGMEYRKSGTKASQIKKSNYWSYLLAYDRFDYFPNSILGFFYDAGQVFAYSKNLSTFEGSALHKYLETINSTNPNIKLKDVISLLKKEGSVTGYTSQTTTTNIKQYVVAPIFLMLKDELRSADDVSQTKLVKYTDYLLEFGINFDAAVVLLGAFFGYKKFYDTYYNRLGLRFYKSQKLPVQKKKIEIEEKKIEEVISESPQEPIVEERPIDTQVLQQSNENENPTEKFQEIILSILKGGADFKISELKTEFNKQTKRKFTNANLEGILKEMVNKVEIIHKGKKIEKIRLKNKLSLFNNLE